jgi:hypothetical protein
VRGSNQLVQLGLKRRPVAVLRVLNEEYLQQGYDEGPAHGPSDNDEATNGEGRGSAGGMRVELASLPNQAETGPS